LWGFLFRTPCLATELLISKYFCYIINKRNTLQSMKLKKLLSIEKKAEEVWIVSPDLFYDTENDTFKNIVKHNLHQGKKYRYIVPATTSVSKHIRMYQKDQTIPKDQTHEMFLILPESEFNPFLNELAIYNPNSKSPIACLSVWKDADSDDEVIQIDKAMTNLLVKKFKSIWKKYKRENP